MCWSTSSRIRNNRFYSAVLLRTSCYSYVSYYYYYTKKNHFGTPWSPDCSGTCTICRNIRTKFREPQEKSMRAQYIRAHVLCMKWAFSCWGQFLWCIQKNEKKTGFVFVRVKIVMHGLTVTQEFCKLSNVHICSFVCLTFVDASMESLMMNFHRTLDASNVQVLTIAIAVVFCIFSSKCTSPLWFCWLGTTMTGTYKFSAANSKYSACAPSTIRK